TFLASWCEQRCFAGERLARGGVDLHRDDLARLGQALEVDDLVVRRAATEPRGVVARLALNEDIKRAADEALCALARPALNDLVAHVRGVRARVADAVDAVDRVGRREQLGELPRPRAQAGAVRVDVLAEQRDLTHAVGGERLHLGEDLLERPGYLAASRRGN